jgi:RNA polymerase sigma factor (sigma-70 family)
MTIGLAAIDPSGVGAFPMENVVAPAPCPSAPADILTSLRQEVGLRPPRVFPVVRKLAPLPSAAPPSDVPLGGFAHRVESQLAFLRNAARRWHRDKAGADDLVQDTVVRALANAHLWREGQPESNLRGWLFTIMRNRFLAGVARSKRSDAALDAIAAADECVPAATSHPEARLMMRDIERVLLRLPAHQQTAIRLVAIEGRSYEESGRLMGMSVPAVRCHLSRGRERLREMIEGRIASPVPRPRIPRSKLALSHLEQDPSLPKQPAYA